MTVQEIKARNTEREWADIEALVRAISPTLEKNAKHRRDEEVRKRGKPGGSVSATGARPTSTPPCITPVSRCGWCDRHEARIHSACSEAVEGRQNW